TIDFMSTATVSPGGGSGLTVPTVPVQEVGVVFDGSGVGATSVTFQLVNSSETPVITVKDNADGSLTGTTGSVAVSDGALDFIRVNSGAAGDTSVINDYTMTTDDVLTVHASRYDGHGNYIGDSPGTTSWAAGLPFDGGDLSAGVGTSVDFVPDNVGSVVSAVTATDGVEVDSTGTITVNPGGVSYIEAVTDLAGDATAGGTFSVIITAYDVDGNVKTDYAGLKTVNWAHTAGNAPDLTVPVVPVDGFRTFNSGIATVPGFMLVRAEAGVTITPTVDPLGDNMSDATPGVTVVAGIADYYDVATQNGGVEGADTAFTLTVSTYDEYGNAASGYVGAHTIDFMSTATVSPGGGSGLTVPAVPV
ncbi:hypothetical protein LCGC14_3018590, partial [marine sediment metagenome]